MHYRNRVNVADVGVYPRPREAELLAGILTGRGKAEYEGQWVQRTLRLWLPVSLQVDALMESSGRNRNEVINRLVMAGLQAVHDELKPEDRDRLFSVPPDLVKSTLDEIQAAAGGAE